MPRILELRYSVEAVMSRHPLNIIDPVGQGFSRPHQHTLQGNRIMHHSRRLLALSLLFSSLILFNPHTLLAQSDENPIIALSNNNIYAVSPSDGQARLLVERSATKDEALYEISTSIGKSLLLSAISPDNTKFAYAAPLYELLDPAFESKLPDILKAHPNDLTLVDIATGELTPITDQANNLSDAVEHDKLIRFGDMTWSLDSKRLYFVSYQKSMHNRVPQTTIEYYDLEVGERRPFAKIDSQDDVAGLYIVKEGILVVHGYRNAGDFTFTLYDPEGEILKETRMAIGGMMDCTNSNMINMNPVYSEESYYFGYFSPEMDYSPAMFDAASGESIPLDDTMLPSLISHADPENSLRIVYANMCYEDDRDIWVATNTKNVEVSWISLSGIDQTFEMALSPDGQTVAMIKPTERGYYDSAPIVVIDSNGSRELNFNANQIIWGATDFTFAPIIYRG
jgi:hypothetical protein